MTGSLQYKSPLGTPLSSWTYENNTTKKRHEKKLSTGVNCVGNTRPDDSESFSYLKMTRIRPIRSPSDRRLHYRRENEKNGQEKKREGREKLVLHSGSHSRLVAARRVTRWYHIRIPSGKRYSAEYVPPKEPENFFRPPRLKPGAASA